MDDKERAREIVARYDLATIVRAGVAAALGTDASNVDWPSVAEKIKALRPRPAEDAEPATEAQRALVRKKLSEQAWKYAQMLIQADERGIALQYAFAFVFFDRAELQSSATKREASALIDALISGYDIERVIDDALSGRIRPVGSLKNRWWLDIVRALP